MTTRFRLYDLSRSILECAATSLGTRRPKRMCLMPGSEVEWNCCTEDGQLSVGLVASYPSSSFPIPDSTTGPCQLPYMAHTLAVTLLRCSPGGSTNRGPTCEQYQDAAQRLLEDVELVQDALMCCLSDQDSYNVLLGVGYKWVLGTLTTVGPEGGCVGFVQQLTVGLPTCAECCP